MTLVTEMRTVGASQRKLGDEMTQMRRAREAAYRENLNTEFRKQMKEAKKTTSWLIKGLPDFLLFMAKHHSSAYVVYRNGCQPAEHYYPGFERPGYGGGDLRPLSNYKIRRYLRGTIQSVALWGIRQNFHVDLSSISSQDFRQMVREKDEKGIPLPLYMRGMLGSYLPPSGDLLRFSW